jgi:hypothetical protein
LPERLGMSLAATQTLQRSRFYFAALHLLASAAIAGLGALLIFRIWYPAPFDQVAGGTGLFVLLVSVDVVLGPALTLVAASRGKPVAEFRRDMTVIVMLQVAAFVYGLYAVALARPVFESFEIDRLRVVTAVDLEDIDVSRAPAELRALPWLGPKRIAAVRPDDPGETMKSIELALAGRDLSLQPQSWRSYESQQDAAWSRARPVRELAARYPQVRGQLTQIALAAGTAPSELRFLPLVSRRVSWVAVIASGGKRVVGYLPVDGFF